MLAADPTLAGVDRQGDRSKDFASVTAVTAGPVARRVLSMAAYVSNRYRPSSLGVTELFFDHATFGADNSGNVTLAKPHPDNLKTTWEASDGAMEAGTSGAATWTTPGQPGSDQVSLIVSDGVARVGRRLDLQVGGTSTPTPSTTQPTATPAQAPTAQPTATTQPTVGTNARTDAEPPPLNRQRRPRQQPPLHRRPRPRNPAMRVIAGAAKGLPLKAPKSKDLRPTSDKVPGGPLLNPHVRRRRLRSRLDLYAGTGTLGIEALSRGAGSVDFVEHNAAACSAIRDHFRKTGFTERAAVHCSSVRFTITQLQQSLYSNHRRPAL